MLWIDGILKQEAIQIFDIIESGDQIRNLYQRYYSLVNPPDLYLNAIGLPPYILVRMLKFIEGYRGGLELMVREPVPSTVLSRFCEKYKYVFVEDKPLLSLILTKSSVGDKVKIKVLDLLVG